MQRDSSARRATHQTVRLTRGSHRSPDHGACVMELASMLAGEPFSDRPECACRVIGAVLRAYNDSVDDVRRQDLYGYASAVVGTRGDGTVELARADRCIEWAAQRRAERGPLRRWMLGHSAALAGAHPCQVFMRHVTPLLRRPDDATHAQVLALLDELIAMGARDAGVEPAAGVATGAGVSAGAPVGAS